MTNESQALKPSFYYEKGWNIVPIYHNEKGKTPGNWSTWRNQKIDNPFKNDSFDEYGAGIIAGQFNNVLGLDLDTDDSKTIAFVEEQGGLMIQTSEKHYAALFEWDEEIKDLDQKEGWKYHWLSIKATEKRIIPLPPTRNKGIFVRRFTTEQLVLKKMGLDLKRLILKVQAEYQNLKPHSPTTKTLIQEPILWEQREMINEPGRNNRLSEITGILIRKYGRNRKEDIENEIWRLAKESCYPPIIRGTETEEDKKLRITLKSIFNAAEAATSLADFKTRMATAAANLPSNVAEFKAAIRARLGT